MKKYKVYINGKLVPAEKAQISVFDGAYLYGEGLFETMIAIDGQVPFLKDHLRRLIRGVKALGIRMPLSKDGLRAAITKTLKANGLKKAYIRLNVSAEEAVKGKRRKASDTHIVIIVKPPDPYPQKLYKHGARLVVVKNIINDPACVASIKTSNYLIKVLGRRQVMARKADEGVLLNAKGYVSECTSSNIFLIKRGRLRTPALSEGLMPGVTRKKVMNLARRLKIPVQESVMGLKEIEVSDEVFITSTLKGIMPVASLGKKRIGSQIPGLLTKRLMDAYEARLRMKS